MLRNYLKIAVRTLLKNRAFAAINIFGLAVGIACCVLIFLYIEDELSYDRFHESADQIYRLRVERYSSNGESELTATSSAPMLRAAESDIPQIDAAVRMQQQTYLVEYEDRGFYEDKFFAVDSTFFDVFSFKLLKGDPKRALVAPFSVVLTERAAGKYFGRSDPIGQTLQIEDRAATVTGVVENPPSQSHFDFDMLGSFTTLESLRHTPSENWNWWNLRFYTYFKLTPSADVAAVAEQIREMPSRYIGDQESNSGYRQFLYLQPLTDIHLRSSYQRELEANSQVEYVYVFGAIALFILLLACINFMNLATARSAKRAKEVGMRKVSGASRKQLMGQFLGESILVGVISVALAMILIKALLPVFNQLAFKTLSFSYLDRYGLVFALLAGGVGIGFLAGIYPAFVLSAFKPVRVLKGQVASQGGSVFFREALVVFQFVISVTLIVGAVIANTQLNYMRTADLGFDKEQILVMNTRNNQEISSRFDAFKAELEGIPDVTGVTFSSSIPGRAQSLSVISKEQGMNVDGMTFNILAVDEDFLDVYRMDVIEGRKFQEEMVSDETLAFMMNEAALDALGFTSAEEVIGVELTRQFNDSRNVIGVVRDFHFESMKHAVAPIVLQIQPSWYQYVSVRIASENPVRAMSSIESVWGDFSVGRPMDYFFLDEEYDKLYRTEVRISGIINSFTILAIVIACLGLFALASFIAEQRTKEIGVRKVLGASTSGIVIMLTSSFTKLVLLATLISIPLAYFGSQLWLENFVYRISVGWEVFVVASVMALLIAWLTVAYQSIRAALTNPVNALHQN